MSHGTGLEIIPVSSQSADCKS